MTRSLKWDQPGISSFIRLKDTSKTRLIVKRMGLKKIAGKVWRAITPENLQQLYQSMPRRMQAIIDAGGAHTRYQNTILSFVCSILASY